MDVSKMPWWERDKLLTEKDRKAIAVAKGQSFCDIDENAAETDAGRYELHALVMRKYHREESLADQL